MAAKERYQKRLKDLEKEHQEILSKLTDHQEIKDEKYVYKNRLSNAKIELEKDLQQIKDRRHAAYNHKFHLIDLLRLSKFTFLESRAQKWENYKYTFNRRAFLPSEWIVYCDYHYLHRTVYYYSNKKYTTFDLQQRFKYPAAGVT